MRNDKELVGCDRILVLDRVFFRNPKMDEPEALSESNCAGKNLGFDYNVSMSILTICPL